MFHDTSLKAEPLFEQAIKLDPNFAAAFAGLSMVESWVYHSFDPVPSRREKARLNAEDALRLQPDLPEATSLSVFSYYYGDRDYERALAEFDIARRGLPNESQAYLASVPFSGARASGRNQMRIWKKPPPSIRKTQTSWVNFVLVTSPSGIFETPTTFWIVPSRRRRKRFSSCIEKDSWRSYGRGILARPKRVFSQTRLKTIPEGLITWGRAWILTLERKFPEALQVLGTIRGETMFTTTTAPAPKAFLQSLIHLLQGDKTKAQPELEHARPDL